MTDVHRDAEGESEGGWIEVRHPRYSKKERQERFEQRERRRISRRLRQLDDPYFEYKENLREFRRHLKNRGIEHDLFYPYQDTVPVVFDRRPRDENGNLLDVATIERRKTTDKSRRMRKVENAANEGNYKLQRFRPEFIKQVKQSREEMGITQSQLANMINRPESDIRDLERGTLTYEPALKSLLRVYLRKVD